MEGGRERLSHYNTDFPHTYFERSKGMGGIHTHTHTHTHIHTLTDTHTNTYTNMYMVQKSICERDIEREVGRRDSTNTCYSTTYYWLERIE